jgi:hypothetical protein
MASVNDDDLNQPRPIKPQSRLLDRLLQERIDARLDLLAWAREARRLHTEEGLAEAEKRGEIVRFRGRERGNWE